MRLRIQFVTPTRSGEYVCRLCGVEDSRVSIEIRHPALSALKAMTLNAYAAAGGNLSLEEQSRVDTLFNNGERDAAEALEPGR